MPRSSALVEFERARREYRRLTAADEPATPAPAGPAVLWKYTDPDGKDFYLEEKKTTVKSPFTGKSFTGRPKRHTPAQVGRELKDKS